MDKKQRERAVLNLVYDESEYDQVDDGERPDFRIRHKGTEAFFGVEITELYDSEAAARVLRIPDYVSEIVSGNKYRHKVDKVELEAKEYKVTSAEGHKKKPVRGIIRKVPNSDEYRQLLVEKILEKEGKYTVYHERLHHVNLVILDMILVLATHTIEEIFMVLSSESVRNVLYKSHFREIFLVTRVKEKDRVYIPLKLILLFSDFHMLHMSLSEYFAVESEDATEEEPEGDRNPRETYFMLFAQYLRTKTDQVMFRKKEGFTEVILGNSSLFTREGEGKLNIMDYYDRALPADAKYVEEDDENAQFFLSPKFLEVERMVRENYTVAIDMADHIKGEFKL